ncbi:hypothetical protein TVAG_271290 [Trichomonas vaginalis G3]|uniref:Uncharacterized protein n=1 Tax=Trichomonas vaginalis (strain ATCC PRA-98 / G3) TaxID=412133 RepID=A2EA98_TRIV3|nr:hypothetical protein TVAGG3_0167480 [Trichomonas vaginalis G3]EAY10438.1 hypothetical protein TVAG_271290 [Trichomonas vaginalis G3]KAI5548340.1 hypothetical protein TVAGG3_0167480 [Trichomonas vaginalis G3]|eukprot:XP_001322661.1 hypothetical protein [Trichomonas vaginalis G3]
MSMRLTRCINDKPGPEMQMFFLTLMSDHREYGHEEVIQIFDQCVPKPEKPDELFMKIYLLQWRDERPDMKLRPIPIFLGFCNYLEQAYQIKGSDTIFLQK